MKKIAAVLAVCLVVSVFLLTACAPQPTAEKQTATPAQPVNYTAVARSSFDDTYEECVSLCRNAQEQGMNLSPGPCLSDRMHYPIDDWVCDIAHRPRQPVDNLPENQCAEFRDGKAHHFIEFDENCEFIRRY